MSHTKWAILGIVIVCIIIIAYFSYLPLDKARNIDFIITSEDLGNGITQQNRFRIHPTENAIITYVNITGPYFDQRQLGALKHRVILSSQNIGTNIIFPGYKEYGITKPQLVQPPVYGLARIAGFYRISDGQKTKWLKTAKTSTYGNNIDEYMPTEANSWLLPSALF